MKPYFTTNTVTLYHGSALDVLKGLPTESVQTCVTSPPYFGLRAYGTDPQIWQDGQPLCEGEHNWSTHPEKRNRWAGDDGASDKQRSNGGSAWVVGQGDTCQSCGAWRGELGLEPTPELYVEHLVAIFREVKRVLRDDGTLWVNIGDSYAGSWGNYGGQNRGNGKQRSITTGSQAEQKAYEGLEDWRPPTSNKLNGIKPKDLIGIPWMLAFALRADSWYLRADIIWNKPAPMPESVTDRPTKAHEYIFLLSKSPAYYYDHEAILEPFADERLGNPGAYKKTSAAERKACNDRQDLGFINSGGGWNADGEKQGRNKRSVWTVNTKPFPDAHFAVFPPALIEPCIKAGCPEGGTVLDPFSGSGTTLAVADRLGRKAVGIELNESYCAMHKPRFAQNNLFSLVENV